MRHFFRTQLVPVDVLRIADEFFPEIGMERSGHTARSRTFAGDLGTLQLSVRMYGIVLASTSRLIPNLPSDPESP